MRLLSHAVAAGLLLCATAAPGAIITIGGGFAASCYEVADAQDGSRDALDTCDNALTSEALTPRDRMATLVNRGIVHLRRAELVEAEADFDAALAIDATEAEVWLNKAILKARFGKSVEAMPLVQKAIDLNTKRPALAYFVRAMAFEDAGNVAAAYSDLQRARKLDPRWAEPRIELKRFQVRQL